MNLNYNNEVPREEIMFKDYMDDVKEQALQKLSNTEIAAIYNDFTEFSYLYRMELLDKIAETYLD